MAIPPAEIMPPTTADFNGKRRWKYSTDTNFYTFEEFVQYCEKERFMRPESKEEGAERTVRGGAMYLWRMAFDEVHEEEVAGRRAEAVRELPQLPLEAFRAGSSVAVLLQSVSPPPTLLGPSKGGGCLRVNKQSLPDCWGGVGQRAALRIEVVQAMPTIIVRICGFSGVYLRTVAEGKVRWDYRSGGADDNEQASLFELLPRSFNAEEPLTVVSLMPKGGAECIGTFAVFSAPAHLTMFHVDLDMPQAKLDRFGELAKQIAQVDPEYQGRRRHKQDNKMNRYSFEEMVRWAAHKFHATKEDEALELGRAIWQFMCIEELDDGPKVKRVRDSMDSWNVVFAPPALGESVDVNM